MLRGILLSIISLRLLAQTCVQNFFSYYKNIITMTFRSLLRYISRDTVAPTLLSSRSRLHRQPHLRERVIHVLIKTKGMETLSISDVDIALRESVPWGIGLVRDLR